MEFWEIQFNRLINRWCKVWRKHNSHREHRGTRRKGKKRCKK